MNYAYFQVTSGPAFELCDTYIKSHDATVTKVKELALKYHGTPGRSLTRGPWLLGLHFGGVVPKGWQSTKAHPGFAVPARTKLGKEIAEDLKTVEFPSPEKLAVALGCKAFFRDFDDGGDYCASVGIMEHGGTFYLETSKWCPPDLKKFPGIEQIPASQWHKADEDHQALGKKGNP